MTLKKSAAILLAGAALLAACGDDDDPPAAVTAAEMCTAVANACSAANAQWPGADAAAMNTACTADATTRYKWTAGARDAQSGNTLACRLWHAGQAATNAAVHCPHAGPTGGGVCGSYCDNYCDLNVANCGAAPNQNFADRATCMTACTGAAFATTGVVNATSGNTIQCRIWHLGQAATNAATHCPHARVESVTAAGGAGPCTDPT
jgi:hypothetical protein